MARKTKIQKLQEELESTKLALHNEKVLHANTEGKLEHADERLEELDSNRGSEIRHVENYARSLEDQVQWLRGLVEDLAMPKEKLEMMMNARNEVRIEGRPHPDMLNPKFR